jgi:glucokinase
MQFKKGVSIMTKKIFGIDLGGTSIKLSVVSTEGDIIDQWSVPTDNKDEGQHIIHDLNQAIDAKMKENNWTNDDILGIGMGSPGVVNREKGTVTGAYNLSWVDEQPVADTIRGYFNADWPIFIENDANVAALGEQWKGAGDHASDVVLVTLGTGVGGGVIVNNQLVVGQGAAGEIGHMFSKEDGRKCTCGKHGCLETVASASGIVWTAGELAYAMDDTGSAIQGRIFNGDKVTSEDIFKAAQAGDVFAEAVVDETMSHLGRALGQIAAVTNPKYILIGGGVANAGQYLLDKVTQHFNASVYPGVGATTHIKLATLGNDAGVYGAASLVMANI